jgi:RimJ/RimL family protein N-acetyltransferase
VPADDDSVARCPDDPGPRRVPLPEGGLLTVRAVARTDVDGLAALYDGLSNDDRYLRFFSSYRPPRDFFERLCSIVERGGYGVVAAVGADGDEGRIVGEASYEPLPNGDGELGMAVASDQRGWLGPFLLDTLIEAAAMRGVPNLEAAVMVTNRRMLALLRARGYATLGSGDWVTLRLVVGTGGRTPMWPNGDATAGHGDRPRVLVETPGGRWHAGAEAEAAGLQVIACSGPQGQRPRCPVLAGQPCPLAAGADAIVVSNVPDDERWRTIVEAHRGLHPGVPVCVEARSHRRPQDQARLVAPPGTTAVTLEGEHPRLIVQLVDRLVSMHRRARARADHPAARSAEATEP